MKHTALDERDDFVPTRRHKLAETVALDQLPAGIEGHMRQPRRAAVRQRKRDQRHLRRVAEKMVLLEAVGVFVASPVLILPLAPRHEFVGRDEHAGGQSFPLGEVVGLALPGLVADRAHRHDGVAAELLLQHVGQREQARILLSRRQHLAVHVFDDVPDVRGGENDVHGRAVAKRDLPGKPQVLHQLARRALVGGATPEPLHRRQRDAGEHGDNPDDHQQLKQRERTQAGPPRLAKRLAGRGGPPPVGT